MVSARYLNFIIILFAVAGTAAMVGPSSNNRAAEAGLEYIKSQTTIFAFSVHQLRQRIDAINPSDPHTVQPAIEALKSCRLQYKKISFFLDYFYPQQGKLFNAPAKREVEEPYMEYEEPVSFQQMEAVLYGPAPQKNKAVLQNLVLVLDESAAGLKAVYFGFNATNAQIAESLHLELIRIMSLYIAGYDAPELKTGIVESRSSLESVSYMADLVFQPVNAEARLFDSIAIQAIRFTRFSDFDHFDRLHFLTQYALPLEEQLNRCIKIYGLQLSTVPSLNYNAKNLFAGEFNYDGIKSSETLVALGRQLFFEKSLSGNNSRSCASCHQPEKYFTDQKIANEKINSTTPLRRNTPTLLYVSYQSAQFWDGRAATLSEQISDVLTNPDEMNSSIPKIKRRLSENAVYHSSFPDSVNLEKIEAALSAYLHTLQPMNSLFDRYIAGDQQALTNAQKNGFNLFMGKARCGSCHFAPVFNGTTPPFYNRSEYEILGVPALGPSATYTADKDLGRYEHYPISLYKRAFKTPTIRNTEKTGPYMHNGRFNSLNQVLDFYNRGGGAGLGLSSPEQTLSAKPLHLSKDEISAIIGFLGALTDNLQPSKIQNLARR